MRPMATSSFGLAPPDSADAPPSSAITVNHPLTGLEGASAAMATVAVPRMIGVFFPLRLVPMRTCSGKPRSGDMALWCKYCASCGCSVFTGQMIVVGGAGLRGSIGGSLHSAKWRASPQNKGATERSASTASRRRFSSCGSLAMPVMGSFSPPPLLSAAAVASSDNAAGCEEEAASSDVSAAGCEEEEEEAK